MFIAINLQSFSIEQTGFVIKPLGNKTLYLSPGLDINHIEELSNVEYGQAVVVDTENRSVSFGRDYLGHHPLLYAEHAGSLLISDELDTLRIMVGEANLSVSKFAVALYFTMGFIPQGMTLYAQIIACENTAYYEWKRGRTNKISLFEPIEIKPNATLSQLQDCISSEVRRIASSTDEIDVWCSGGLDSSSMALEFNSEGRTANLVTLGYGHEITSLYGEAEIPYAQIVANACKAPLRLVDLSDEAYAGTYDTFLTSHNSPIIDTCVLAKYALAAKSRRMVVTGEGGDPLFGGVKNDMVMFALSRKPARSMEEIYALAHKRFFLNLSEIIENPKEMRERILSYFRDVWATYPGDEVRKLFYLNTLLKQGGMIFPQSYYACKRYGITARHPLSSLAVYRAAFSLPDDVRYIYPTGKLALLKLYQNRLPKQIIQRKKVGTHMPMRHYLSKLPSKYFDSMDTLAKAGINESLYSSPSHLRKSLLVEQPLLLHSILTLNNFINKGVNSHESILPITTSRHLEPTVCANL